jgi:hypothetical protein
MRFYFPVHPGVGVGGWGRARRPRLIYIYIYIYAQMRQKDISARIDISKDMRRSGINMYR